MNSFYNRLVLFNSLRTVFAEWDLEVYIACKCIWSVNIIQKANMICFHVFTRNITIVSLFVPSSADPNVVLLLGLLLGSVALLFVTVCFCAPYSRWSWPCGSGLCFHSSTKPQVLNKQEIHFCSVVQLLGNYAVYMN